MRAPGFGPWLLELRKQRGLSVRQLARRARIAYSYLSRLERGIDGPPSEDVCRRLADALSTPDDPIGPQQMCRRAGRIPTSIERAILTAPSWLAIIREAPLRRWKPAELLEVVRSRPQGGAR
jgi:transcriptional regulator with XRE-family HTH domain